MSRADCPEPSGRRLQPGSMGRRSTPSGRSVRQIHVRPALTYDGR